MPSGIQFVLVILAIAAAFSDIRTRKIPNWITVPGAVMGFSLNTYYEGVGGGMWSLAGACLGFGIFIAFYIAGGMGAGDVKLFSAVGALTGPRALVVVFVFTALLGGIAAAALAASRGRLTETLQKTALLLLDLGRQRWTEIRETGTRPDGLRLPYGAVIAGGVLLSLVVNF